MSEIKIIDSGQEEFLRQLYTRRAEDIGEVMFAVSEILERVRVEGDQAICEFSKKFDGVELTPDGFLLDKKETEKASDLLDDSLKETLSEAWDRLLSYHSHQLRTSWFTNGPDGEILGQKISPVDSAAIYAPGGKAAYPSSVLMGFAPAVAAGVERLVLFSPPSKDGSLNPAVLYAASLAGVSEIYRIGGAQAIGAAAFGTNTIRPVDVITGPGNVYVTAAKKLVFGRVNIDMLAGPSEILVIADSSANPDWVAVDLLSQAEHDEKAGAILITPDRELAKKTAKALSKVLAGLPKKDIAGESIREYGAILIADSIEHAAELSNRFAPEHLELCVEDPWAALGMIRHAGAIFMGHHTPEAIGDYWAGPNHVLPTGGSARSFGPLGVEAYIKKSSIVAFNDQAAQAAVDKVALLARAEGLEAHALSVEARKRNEE